MTALPRASADSLPGTIRALGWTSFLTDLSSEAIYPLLPAFVKSLGGTSVEIGLIDGVANAVAAIVRLPSGAVSDSIGRRPLVLFGYGLSAIIRPLMGLVASPVGVSLEHHFDLIPHLPEHGQLFLIRARRVCRVIKPPMMAVQLTGENWAGLVGVAADCDDCGDITAQKLVHVL